MLQVRSQHRSRVRELRLTIRRGDVPVARNRGAVLELGGTGARRRVLVLVPVVRLRSGAQGLGRAQWSKHQALSIAQARTFAPYHVGLDGALEHENIDAVGHVISGAQVQRRQVQV